MIIDLNQTEFEISGIGEQDDVSLINLLGQKVEISVQKHLSEKATLFLDKLVEGEYVLVINGVRLQRIVLNAN